MVRSFSKIKEDADGVILKWREVNGDSTIEYENFKAYFYIKLEDFLPNRSIINNYSDRAFNYTDCHGKKFVKVILKNNFFRKRLRSILESNHVKCFEADINASKRWLLNNSEKLNYDNLKILYFDIETDDRGGGLVNDENGKVIAGERQVLSIAAIDSDNYKYFYINEDADDKTLKGETKLLKQFSKLYKKYDIVTAWNGYRFDYPYLEQRGERCGVDFDWSMVNLFDEKYKFQTVTYSNHKSFSLNFVAEAELGDKKINLDGEPAAGKGRFYGLWKNNKELLHKYNIKDCELMVRIEEKLKLYNIYKALSKIGGVCIEQSNFNSHACDHLTLKLLHESGEIANSKPNWHEMEKNSKLHIGGGYTFCYEPGYHENVEVFDYKSEYPLIMATFNISPESFFYSEMPDYEELCLKLTKKHADALVKANNISEDCTVDGRFNYRKAMKMIDGYWKANNLKLSVEELMWEFNAKYHGEKLEKHCKANNLIYTPADFNLDTNGWRLHPHRIYTSKDSAFRKISLFIMKERDEVKYKLNAMSRNDANYREVKFYQFAIKTIGNSLFGFSGLKSSRFFDYNVADAITTVARWQMKKSISFAKSCGYRVTSGDTDSIFLKRDASPFGVDTLNQKYFDYYDELYSPFNTNLEVEVVRPNNDIESKQGFEKKKHTKKYYCVFEHEKTYKKLLIATKKKYYYTDENGNVDSQGGTYRQRATNPYAAELQLELLNSIFKGEYNIEGFILKLKKLREEVFSFNVPIEKLKQKRGYRKHWSKFGMELVDGKTGNVKLDKNGEPRKAPVPSYINLIRKLDEKGELSIELGDSFEFIIGEKKPESVRLLYANRHKKALGEEIVNEITSKLKSLIVDNKEVVIDFNHLIDGDYAIAGFNDSKLKFKIDKSSKQMAITEEEFLKTKKYDAAKYWDIFTTPIFEILKILGDDKKVNEALSDLTK